MTDAPAFLLTDAEIRAMTGAVRRARQLAWFADRGVRAELGGDNRVKVLRAAAERFMLNGGQRSAPVRQGPNLSALRKAG